MEELEAKVEELEKKIADLEEKVAFQGFRRVYGNSGEDTSIAYEDITLNFGDAFDGTTFTAPVAGTVIQINIIVQ